VTPEERREYQVNAMRVEALEFLGTWFAVVTDPPPADDQD
jgi:hypothetical protein